MSFDAGSEDSALLAQQTQGRGGWASVSQLSFLDNLGAKIAPTFQPVGRLTYREASLWIDELKQARYTTATAHRSGLYDSPPGGYREVPAQPTPPVISSTPAPSPPPMSAEAHIQETTKEQETVKSTEIMSHQREVAIHGTQGVTDESALRAVVKRDVLPPDATDADLARYLLTCREYGFSPLKRQVYAMRAGGRIVVEASIDGLLSLAESTGEFAGADEPVIEYDSDKHIIAATATVWRWHGNERYPITATALWSEYGVAAQAKVGEKGQRYSPWYTMPATMIGKVAMSKALRRGFPRALSGLYSREEMDQARD